MDYDQASDVLASAYQSAPQPIRDYIRSGKLEALVAGLQTRLGLMQDVADRTENEIVLMLLGMSDPLSLADNLRSEARVPEAAIPQIIQEVSTQIFTPFQRAMEASTPAPAPKPQPVVPVMKIEVPAGTPVKPVAPPHDEIVPVLADLPPAPARAVPPPAPAAPRPMPAPQAPLAPKPVMQPREIPITPVAMPMRTMATDAAAMKEGKAPAPLAPAAAPIVQKPVAPIAPPAAPPSTSNHAELTSTLKKYGIDPYREAVE